jgi:capsular polysaccharide export protein
LAWRHPGYRSHLPLNPFLEYAGWIRRFVRAPITRRRTETALASLSTGDRPFFLLPLQLDSDSQLRINSPFGRLAPAVELILDSFARSAPPETLLVLKEHPLDPQLIDWRRLAHDRARRLGIADRILYLYGGDLRSLIERSRGVVTVNSTSGILALSLGVPVVALASPIYELPGLTFPGGLDGFWRGAGAPDPVLFDAFRRVVAVRTQVNGGFFSRKALALAVEGSVARLEAAAAGRALVEISHVAPSGVDASAATAMARDATR